MGASTVCVCVCVTHMWWVVPVSQVFDGAVIVLSLAPMVASTVANGPSSPWDAIGLIITLRIWRAKRIIDGEAPGGGGGGGQDAVLDCRLIDQDWWARSGRFPFPLIMLIACFGSRA